MKIVFPDRINGHEKQELIWHDDTRFIDILAGRRGGKDWISARKFIKNIYRDKKQGKGEKYWNMDAGLPCLLYWAVAPTYKIGQVQKKEILRYLYRNGADSLLLRDRTNTNGQLWLRGGILIEFKSAENPNNLVAEGLNGVYITETARLKANVWNDNLYPTLSDKQGWGIFATTPLGDNWYISDIRSLAENADVKDWKAYYWKTIENIKCPGLVDEVERARLTMPAKYFKRNYEACRDAFFGQVYDEFDANIHVCDWYININDYKVITGGIDWGWNHPTVVIVIGITNDDCIDVLYEEYDSFIPVVSEDISDDTWVTRARDIDSRFNGVEMFYCGPDEPEHIQTIGKYVCATAGENSVNAGIEYVANMMHVVNGRSRLRIHKSCELLISNMKQYRWKADRDGKEIDQPEKKNDDAVDALRYAIYSSKHWME